MIKGRQQRIPVARWHAICQRLTQCFTSLPVISLKQRQCRASEPALKRNAASNASCDIVTSRESQSRRTVLEAAQGNVTDNDYVMLPVNVQARG